MPETGYEIVLALDKDSLYDVRAETNVTMKTIKSILLAGAFLLGALTLLARVGTDHARARVAVE